ncbi:sensor histidine kinase [Kaistella antarctica]|uniref:histidine kinase n=1 Tax=Kaistella antarctica TaxID=266748 RepID=A0A3S4WU59_9FLAO|nr:HAMP domain-containing sensor histidine kinase [Kaistella antarctica]KEY18346.1 hypothetical protein HY04_07460 [Kaistella antarctica]SEV84861.1 two-component system, OmpR family, phosphate regulon sensor histidine kinase PhoR [Kaistella antarctica]VEI01035.1 Signal-transduction histidine kinase senX3 [Kaistella antarctica]
MISKSKNLVAAFTILFLLLMGIQAYFLVKTYQLKEREIYRTVYDQLTNFTDRLENQGGIITVTNDSLQQRFIEFKNKEITKTQFLNSFEENRKVNEKYVSQFVDQQFAKEKYQVAAKIEFSSILFVPDNIHLIEKPVVLYETKNKVINPGILNTGTWETSSSFVSDQEKDIPRNNVFLVKSKTSFEILNIKSIIFKELIVLIFSCVALLLGVLLLYIFTLKNLIKQQKQVVILHAVVDNISHEFKTPIATLKIATKTLNKDWNPKTLPLIERQVSRLEGLMLQLHNDDDGGEMIKVKAADWDFIIQDLAFVNPSIQFILKNNTSQELPFDKNLMETVLKNLCENSVKYGASTIKINLSQTERNLEIKVSDNGQGIDKKEFKNIFEKFYRIQSNNIHYTKGLGLGLYFVQKIVEKYKGMVIVASEPTYGTTFKINLPYEN